MLRAGVFPIGRVAGIPVKIHYSWFIVFTLVTSMLAVQWYPARIPDRSLTFYIALSVVSALLLFVSVLLHELAHASLVGRHDDDRVLEQLELFR